METKETKETEKQNAMYKNALDYHTQGGKPGKLEVIPSKPCDTAQELSLAYSPGVAAPCLEIEKDPKDAYKYTNRGNLVAVISNGTAVLGLGNIGALAGKPVMEGKGVLFKRFANVDVFDIEVEAKDNDAFIETVASLEPTFGGINLEDIKAPDCFYIEETLKERMNIPVFHDDQHGTAIITAAGFLNALEVQKKQIDKVRIVFSGAGASAIACANLMVLLGAKRENVMFCDSKGVVYQGRTEGMNKYKQAYAVETDKRTLVDAMQDADVFVGLSGKGLVNQDMVRSMAAKPIIFALANPDPEIPYEEAKAARSDVIMGTGRSDYPNQVNNVLGFPFIFRGALDVRATTINEEMKLAAVKALAELARTEVPESVSRAYGGTNFRFGPEYIIPKPFDPRVLYWVAPAVAKAATDTGVALEPLADVKGYKEKLMAMTNSNFILINSVISRAQKNKTKILFSDAEHLKILHAITRLKEENICTPVLVGVQKNIEARAKELNIKLNGIEIIDVMDNTLRSQMAQKLFVMRQRYGLTQSRADYLLTSPERMGMMLLKNNEVDGMLAGLDEPFRNPLVEAIKILGPARQGGKISSVQIMTSPQEIFFLADTSVNLNPDKATLIDISQSSIHLMKSLGFNPKVAFISFSNFGVSRDSESLKMAEAAEEIARLNPDLEVDGEMQIDVALDSEYRQRAFPFSRLKNKANLFIFPNLASSNVAYRLLDKMNVANTIGPVLLNVNGNLNIMHRDTDVDGIFNLAAVTAAKLPTH